MHDSSASHKKGIGFGVKLIPDGALLCIPFVDNLSPDNAEAPLDFLQLLHTSPAHGIAWRPKHTRSSHKPSFA